MVTRIATSWPSSSARSVHPGVRAGVTACCSGTRWATSTPSAARLLREGPITQHPASVLGGWLWCSPGGFTICRAGISRSGRPGLSGDWLPPALTEGPGLWGSGEAKRPDFRALSVSGERGSNPRPSAWEADALPTELSPRREHRIARALRRADAPSRSGSAPGGVSKRPRAARRRACGRAGRRPPTRGVSASAPWARG